MARQYLTPEKAIELGYTHAANEDGKTRPLTKLVEDELEIIDYPYLVVDGKIDDDGIHLCFKR